MEEKKKKKSSRKSLRTLFSRTEPVPDESAQKQHDRKKFKFPKLKMKTKMEAERQQEVRTPEDDDSLASLKKTSSVCATESRSKVLLSYSDLDLTSPRRFASFSFGLRKRRRRDEEEFSRSAFGLHSNQLEEENPVSRLDLDRADPKTRFSLSQPELDTSGTFDIPSPPAPSSNRAEPLSFTAGSLTRTRPEPEEILSNRTSRTLITSNPEFPVPTARTHVPTVPDLRSKQAEPGADQNLTSSTASRNGDGSDGPSPDPEPHGTSGPRTVVLEQRTGSSRRDSGSTLGEPEPEEALTLSMIPEPEPGSSEPNPTVPGEGTKLDLKVTVELSELDPAAPAEGFDPEPAKCSDPEPNPPVPAESSVLDLMVPAVSAAGSDPEPDAVVPPARPGSGRDSVFGTLYNSLFPPRFFLVRSPDRVPEPEPPGVQTLPLLSPGPGAGFSGSTETKPSRVIRVRTASPVTAESPGTDSRVSGSEPRLVPVGRPIAADCLPPDRGMNVQDFSEPPEPDRALSPAYLSVGSDDGGELYFSAPEETPESGEEADLRDGGGDFETPRGQRSEEKAETASAQVRVWEEPEPPVPQVNRLQECGSAPPAAGAPAEGNQAAETEDSAQKAPNLPGPVLVSDPRRTEEIREELRVRPPGEEEEEEEERAFTRPAAGGTPDAAGRPEGAGIRTSRVNGAAATQRQVSDLTSALDGRRPPGPHPARAAAHLDGSCQPPEPEPDDRMSSGYSSLSTKLTLKNPSPPREEEPKPRFHKVSLVTMETSSTPEPDDPEPEYKWKNRFQGVTQFKSSRSPLPEDNEPSSRFSSSDSSVYLSPAGGGEWRRSLLEEGEESAAPAGEEDELLKGETEWRKSRWELEPLSDSSCSTEDKDSSFFTGVFKATLVDLTPDPPASPDPPTSPDVDSPVNDMDSLVDTLRSMGPSQRPRSTGVRAAPPPLVSTLSPIREDTGNPVISTLSPIREDTGNPVISTLSPIREDTGNPVISTLPPIREDVGSPFVRSTPQRTEEPQNQLYTLPLDLGLKRNVSRDARSPMELMKIQELTSSLHNGNGTPSSPTTGSRLDNSVLFSSYRSSNLDLKLENGTAHRPPFRSLPDTGTLGMRLSETGEAGPVGDAAGSRLERLSFLVNSSSSLNGDAGPSRISRSPSLILGSPTSNSPTRLLSPTGSIDPHRAPTISEPHPFSQGPGVLRRSLSYEGLSQASLFSSLSGGPQFSSLSGGPQFSSLSGGPQFSSLSGGPQFSSLSGGPQFSSLSGGPQFSSLSGGPQFSSLSGGPQFSSLSGGPQFSSLSGGPQFSSLSGGPQFSSLSGGPQFSSVQAGSRLQNQKDEPDSNLMSKYRAFPDAYLTKEKEHGKLNPRPGKIYIFDRPGMCGRRMEIRGDVMDATSWELQDTISIRVVRGGWVLYEKPNFKGEKIALDEGDVELTGPFSPPEEALQNRQEEEKKNGETEEHIEEKPTQKFIIGSIRRAVRDYSVPEICLFPEENAEGKKVVFRDTAEDARIFGFPIKANSIIVNAGLWLVFAQPFFQGDPRILEVGGYSTPAAWGVEQPYVGSVHPLKVGEPRVENMSQPKMVIYEKPYFSGKSRTISSNMRDFMSRTDRQQNLFMASLGSLKVLGGIWVGYENEGFRGHQYLLEEGEYQDWRVWGGCDSELRSVRIIRADLTDPVMVMFEQPEEEQGVTEEKTFEVTEAIPDVELFDYKTSTRSIHVLSGAWIAYSHVDFSGNQYILEKGFYNNCADWGSQDTRVCSVQPILPAPAESSGPRDEIILYSEPDFQGECLVFHHSQGALSEKFLTGSCRVVRGSWVLCENKQFSGNMYVLSEEDYPSLTSMGCPSSCSVLSIKLVPMTLSVPSVSLFGLEGLEGREITTESEVTSLVQDGFNDHILSVRVNSGCWVLCEHSNYRGRQFLLEPIEITNWPKFSSLDRIGSMYPIRQKRHFFRVKNKESGHFLSVQGGVEELKSGRVVAAAEVEPLSDIWFYQEGRIKNKLSPSMCLQVMGSVEPAAKVVLWNESRQPIQNWSAKMQGPIGSLTFPGMVLDVKGGRAYDKEHVVVMPENDERPSQQWEIQLL
ncbi:uncharacterized protein crybg2 isoform X2 [Gambusia affinis]|uniref:uncharacterized protein crybg2 isoform X2 n=1 Tax=Gambusia affinis TaxID=33528 RepID=UPI001CDC040F|nr:uncharacterized protein crybg2 isoform X2 [Gambusia affinis]